jgi:tetratricopeptide (TPR) repeat protein
MFWRALTGIAARLARARNRLHTAEAYETLCAQWDRQQAGPYLSMPSESLGEGESRAVRTLAESLFRLGEILRRQGFESSEVDEEAVQLREKLRETRLAAKWARELGQHYTEILAIRNLVTAERWLRHSFELTGPEDRAGKAACLALLGRVAWERFNEARQANHAERDLIRHLSSARKYYQRALVQDSPEDHSSLSIHNQQLGHVCYAMGDLDRALPYYRECIRHAELEGSKIRAAHARFDLAIALRDSGRLEIARRYAIETARDFESLGDSEPGMLDRARRLVELIERNAPASARPAGIAGYEDSAISVQDR